MCFGHIMFNTYQYATNDEKVITSLKHIVSVKSTHGNLQKIITWTKNWKREGKNGKRHVVKRSCSLRNSRPQWKLNLLVMWLCLTNYWNSKRPFSCVMGKKGQLFCSKKFLMLRYGELQKHSQMFWIVLSLPMWWISHKVISYYLMFSLHLLIWH